MDTHTRIASRLATVVASVLLVLASASAVSATPLSEPVDDGLDNCTQSNRNWTGYIGSETPRGPETWSDSMQKSTPQNWCSISYGDGALKFGPDGLRLGIPNTPARGDQFTFDPFHFVRNLAWVTSNSEVVGHAAAPPGSEMSMNVDGRGITNLQGTVGWGYATRSINPFPLECAWFFYNNSDYFLPGGISAWLDPVFRLLGTNNIRGFFVMTKSSQYLIPQVHYLPDVVVNGIHNYKVKVFKNGWVEYYVDNYLVHKTDGGPIGVSIGLDGRQVDMVGQIWIDGNYWYPAPIPQPNPFPHGLRMWDYQQTLY